MRVHIHYYWNYAELTVDGELPLGRQGKLCAWAEGNEQEKHKKSFY